MFLPFLPRMCSLCRRDRIRRGNETRVLASHAAFAPASIAGGGHEFSGRKHATVRQVAGSLDVAFDIPYASPRPTGRNPRVAELAGTGVYCADVEMTENNTVVSVVRVDAGGNADTSFGEGGLHEVLLGIRGGIPTMFVRGDGNLIVIVVQHGYNAQKVGLICFRPDGSLDTRFAGAGKIVHDIPSPASGSALPPPFRVEGEAFAGDGRASPRQEGAEGLVQAARADDGAFYCLIGGRFSAPYALLRFRADGELDTTFNGTGYVTEGMPHYDEWSANSMLIGTDGGVTIVGGHFTLNERARRRIALWRFHADGSRDTTFGENGYVFFDAGSVDAGGDEIWQIELNHIAQLPDGGFASCGNYHTRKSTTEGYRQFGLLGCFDRSGTLLASFNGGRFLSFADEEWPEADFTFGGLCVQPDGKILAAGGVGDNPVRTLKLLVVRFLPDGRPDPGFANDGPAVFSPMNHQVNYMSQLTICADGRLLGAGAGGPDNQLSRMTPYLFWLLA